VPTVDPRAVGRQPGVAIEVVGYRNQAADFDPRSGDGARRMGGRFNPAHSFPVLYLCSTRPCVVAELTRQAARQNLSPEDLLPREIWRIQADLDRVLDLTDATVLAELGLDAGSLVLEDRSICHQIGEAAHEHRFQAIRSPSATGVGLVLGIFTENLAGSVLKADLVETLSIAADL
jgi:RES domain-containing protein